MRYNLLGKSGLRVSELCLGTMTFGMEWKWGSCKTECRKVYDTFRTADGNFIDTADLYTNGTSERFLGSFVAGHREEVVLATKYTLGNPGNDPNAAGKHRKNMMQSVEASLKRLKTDYIDLYWLHIWDFMTPVEEVMRAFDDLVRQGKILYVGISDTPAWVIARADTMAELRGWTPFTALQIEYSLIERTPERELLPMARALDLAVTPWSPLAGGILSGKYLKKGGKRRDAKRGLQPDAHKTRISQAVAGVANEIGHTPAQVALAWLRQQPGVVIPIIGTRTPAQLKDNLGSLEFTLEGPHLQKLNEASRIELGFPNDFFASDMVRGYTYSGMYNQIDDHRLR
jgi:aryl-alcohol dehydrogenase-like predicted oxidoreductase